MNRNTEMYMGNVPQNPIQRSKIKIPFSHKTTFDTGNLIPFYCSEMLPADTFDVDFSTVIRMTTPVYPVMDNAYLDYYFFFVPNRLVWEHWKEFNGENTLTAWEQTTEYTIPVLEAPSGGWTEGTIADYMGIPTKIDNIEVNALPFRAYRAIWNRWFRDQNRKDPCMVHLDETTRTGTNDDQDYVNSTELGGAPLKVAKYYDIFTGTLPEPQKGPDVFIPLGGRTGTVPVVGDGTTLGIMQIANDNTKKYGGLYNLGSGGTGLGANQGAYGKALNDSTSDGTAQAMTSSRRSGITDQIGKSGLVAVLDYASGGTQTNSTINQLRQAFAIQRHYEKLARTGSRYREVLRAMFGVAPTDARLQDPEYVGGERIPISITAVLQTSSTDETSPQGNVSANSMTSYSNHAFTYTALEHGYMIGVCCVRTDHTYQQGLEQMWNRRTVFDFYWPTLANIGETAILNKRIYAQGSDIVDEDNEIIDEQVFGYQEAWAEYRYMPNRVSGLMRSNATGTLDSWHYADYYTELPIGVSTDWIDEVSSNVRRTLAVQNEPQFIADFYVHNTAIRPMPVYSVPGLIDHN